MRKVRWPGEWKTVCDTCGFQYPSSEMRKRWDGAIVCRRDFEIRHPQTFLKVKSEHLTPPFVRNETQDAFVAVTYSYPLDDPTH